MSRCIGDIFNIACLLTRTIVENIIVITRFGNGQVVIVGVIRSILCHGLTGPPANYISTSIPNVHVHVVPVIRVLIAYPELPRLGARSGARAGGTAAFAAVQRNGGHIVAFERHTQKGNGFLRNCHLNRMYIRIIGDTGSIVVDLAERVGTGFGLGILLVGRNRKLPGSSIGCCRSENLSSFVRQLECKVPSAILRYAVLEQSLSIISRSLNFLLIKG